MKRHKRLAIITLTFLGTVLGAFSGLWLGRGAILWTANAALNDYAADLIHHADEYANELRGIRRTFNPSRYPYCSDREISEMQSMTFRSLQVKEIGRSRGGKLDCSAFLGRLNPPLPMPPPNLKLSDGTLVYINVPLAIADHAPGTVLSSGDVNVVLSPNAFDHWNHPHVLYSVVLVNPETHRFAPVAGTLLEVDPQWILAQGEKRSAGELYRSRCSEHTPVCIVTAESKTDILSGTGSLMLGYSSLGSLAGFGLSLAISLFYLQRKGLAYQLRRAIAKDRLWLVYQPVLDLVSRRCVGAEALARWIDEDGVPVSPDFFVRLAEDRGFIRELTAMVLRRAVGELGEILQQNPEFTLSINIAATDLESESLFANLEEHVRQAGLAPKQIALELTERSTADLNVVRGAILRLHQVGYQVYIDDFGTGFSSLSYLHELAADAVKIDRSFTRTIGTDAATASVLPHILAMAEILKVDVIVEGVETESQVEYLETTKRNLCVQGWYFSRPVSAAQLLEWMLSLHSKTA